MTDSDDDRDVVWPPTSRVVVEPTAAPDMKAAFLGYGLVAATAALLGIVGTVPFLIGTYAVVQWVLAPLGFATADSTNNDGPMVLVLAGVLLPLAIVCGCFALVWWLTERFTLSRRWAWPLAAVLLVLPVVVFAVAKTA